MSKLLRANFVRMFGSVEFMACGLVSLVAGLFNMLSCCVFNAPSYQPRFDRDFFNVSVVAVFASAAFTGLFFGMENSVLRNRLIVGYTRGEVYSSNCLTAFGGVFIINAASLLLYALIAPLRGAKLGELTAEELMFNVLIEILAVLAAGSVCFLVTVIFTRRSICAAGSLIAAIIMTYLPEYGGAMRYSPCGQLEMLSQSANTYPIMASYSLAVIVVTIISGAAIFGRKLLK